MTVGCCSFFSVIQFSRSAPGPLWAGPTGLIMRCYIKKKTPYMNLLAIISRIMNTHLHIVPRPGLLADTLFANRERNVTKQGKEKGGKG